jgi:PAS domain S-box-containing protein
LNATSFFEALRNGRIERTRTRASEDSFAASKKGGVVMDQPTYGDSLHIADRLFADGGEMGERMRELDWGTTPVGHPKAWPSRLATMVATSLRSRFPIVIWWDQRHYTTFYNDAYISFLGKTKHPHWLGRSGKECWQEIWPTIGPMLEGVFATGQPTWSEDLLLVLDRNLPLEEAYFTFSYSAIPGEAGKVEGIFCACTETTERVLSERRLRTLRDLSSRTHEAHSAGEACAVAADVLGQHQTDIPFALLYLLTSDRTDAHLAACAGIPTESRAAVPTISLTSPASSSLWPLTEAAKAQPLQVHLTVEDFGKLSGGPWPEAPDSALVLPLREPSQNQVTGFLVVGVNPRRILDEPYQDFFSVVARQVAAAIANARAYEEERQRAEALAELDRAKTLFFSNVSHEFRTPLTLILGPLEEVLSRANGDVLIPGREEVEVAHRNALRLLKLVNTLLDFSRIESGRIQASYDLVDLASLTADIASVFRSAIEKAGLHFEVDCPRLSQAVWVDAEMWEKIVLNLLSNAFKFTFEGHISVRLREEGRQVELRVSDTGVGIPEAELLHLFERFHRVQGMRARTHEGSGIGLALVQELVKLHGGTIQVSSVVERGTAFTISMPTSSAHVPTERRAAPRALIPTARGARSFAAEALRWLPDDVSEAVITAQATIPAEGVSGQETHPVAAPPTRVPRILLAEDNADLRAYIKQLLAGPYQVEARRDGAAALSAALKRVPDLVLADIMMPRMDGLQLLRALRADPRTSETPIILLSARAGEEAKVEGLEAGADDYLIKPFAARELLARVRAHVQLADMRRRAAEAVRESEAQFRAVADLVPDLLWQSDPSGVTHWYNQRWVEYTGQTLDEALDDGWLQAIHPEDRERSLRNFQQAVQSGQPLRQEHRIRGSNGVYCWFLVQAQPLRDERGRIAEWLVAATNIQEQRAEREELSEQVSNALAQLHDLSRRLLTVQEEERRYLARELHDEIGQALTGLQLRLDAIARTDGLKDMQALADADALVRRLTEQVRTLSMNLRPAVLDSLGLVSALLDLVKGYQKNTGVAVDLRHYGLDQRFSADVEIAAYRVVQEALTNVARHAGAGAAVVQLLAENGFLTVTIRDNGCGFDQALASMAGGLGGMRERMGLLGGTLTIESTPGAGTLVAAEVPLHAGMLREAAFSPSEPSAM